jgi:hypothetical protein
VIQYVGLGWDEAHHPWCKGGYVFTPIELLEHLTKVVIPLQRHKIVPQHAPMNISTTPALPKLGTEASDINDMEKKPTNQNTQLRIDAFREQEHMEENGYW